MSVAHDQLSFDSAAALNQFPQAVAVRSAPVHPGCAGADLTATPALPLTGQDAVERSPYERQPHEKGLDVGLQLLPDQTV